MELKLAPDPQDVFFRCVEDSNEAIMITDASGKLLYVNPAWVHIYKYTCDEAIGQTPGLLSSGLQSDEFYREMWTAIRDKSRGSWKGELINRSKDGTLIPVFLSITPFKDRSGAIRGYIGTALDMTTRKELEEKVTHQDRLASIGLLASGLAHEIGTPLGVVRGRAEFLIMRQPEPGLKRDLEVIMSQIDRISGLIRSLLRVSRTFKNVHLEKVNILNVVNEVLMLVGQNLREDKVDIRLEIDPQLEARADFGRLEQVLLNLVMNSIHAIRNAMESGRPASHALIVSAGVKNGDKVEIEVRDTGCGIAPENLKKLFRPFFTTKDIGEGTGLGLAIVAQLIREMDGKISVESRFGEGASFRVTLNAVT